MGHHTWFVYLDATGHATRAEQVLTEPNFNQITPGMTQDEVRQRLGRPSQTQGLARSRGVVWSYRYENPFCQWFQVEIAQDQKVRSTGYGEPPECERPDSIFIHQ
ncbi:DNA-binding transcriptional activator OsmE [mine drainage metagenome]|uniref:DNA-binding transcriptional activator OsmE n=1 Tax=mine drainage metagenome TaxID=410659 RepID=A0A1J5P7I0_9ZZZZ